MADEPWTSRGCEHAQTVYGPDGDTLEIDGPNAEALAKEYVAFKNAQVAGNGEKTCEGGDCERA